MSIVQPVETPHEVHCLSRYFGLNLNAVAATIIFTVPPLVARCIITEIIVSNASNTPLGAYACRFGISSSPGDSGLHMALNFDVGMAQRLIQDSLGASRFDNFPVYTGGDNIVADVTSADGAALTCDVEVFGYYIPVLLS